MKEDARNLQHFSDITNNIKMRKNISSGILGANIESTRFPPTLSQLGQFLSFSPEDGVPLVWHNRDGLSQLKPWCSLLCHTHKNSTNSFYSFFLKKKCSNPCYIAASKSISQCIRLSTCTQSWFHLALFFNILQSWRIYYALTLFCICKHIISSNLLKLKLDIEMFIN